MSDPFFSDPVSKFYVAPDLGNYKRDLWVLTLGLSAFLLAIWLAGAGLATLLYRFTPELLNQDWLQAVFTPLVIYVAGLPVLMLIISRVNTRDLTNRQKKPGGLFAMLRLFCAGYALTFGTNLLTIKLMEMFSAQAETTFENPLTTMLEEINIPIFLYAVLLGPVLEELVFRGILLRRVRKYGDLAAIVFTSLAFALFHMNLYQLFYTFVLGALFAYVALNYGFIYSCLLHILTNSLGFAMATVLSLELELASNLLAFVALAFVILGVVAIARNLRKLAFLNPVPPLTSGRALGMMAGCPGLWLLVILGVTLSVLSIL